MKLIITTKFPELPGSQICNNNSSLGEWMNHQNWMLPESLNQHIREFIHAITISINPSKHITWDNLDCVPFKEFYFEFFVNDSTYDLFGTKIIL
ncbi:hypothetical protein KFK09_024287 [Dendrobium nobile]|uniref:Uncharacterized protein n=1 Tax=Dendrobium nobile TaxID=94219 RepID=A0A8T3AC86_DENNO|nr:hypothetical protein KFK09_024287 [Dendrobium nobile]